MLNAVVHAANTHRLRHAHAHIHQQTIMRGQEAVTWSMSPALFDSALLTWTTDLNHSWSTFFFFFATSTNFGRCAAIHRSHSAKHSVCDEENGRRSEWKSRDGLKDRAGVRRQNGCALRERRGVFVFWSNRETPDLPVKTFTPRRFTEKQREGNRERGRESIKVTVILVQLNPKFY